VLAGVGGQSHAPAALRPGKRPGTHCRGDCRLEKTNTKHCKISHRPEFNFGPVTAERAVDFGPVTAERTVDSKLGREGGEDGVRVH